MWVGQSSGEERRGHVRGDGAGGGGGRGRRGRTGAHSVSDEESNVSERASETGKGKHHGVSRQHQHQHLHHLSHSQDHPHKQVSDESPRTAYLHLRDFESSHGSEQGSPASWTRGSVACGHIPNIPRSSHAVSAAAEQLSAGHRAGRAGSPRDMAASYAELVLVIVGLKHEVGQLKSQQQQQQQQHEKQHEQLLQRFELQQQQMTQSMVMLQTLAQDTRLSQAQERQEKSRVPSAEAYMQSPEASPEAEGTKLVRQACVPSQSVRSCSGLEQVRSCSGLEQGLGQGLGQGHRLRPLPAAHDPAAAAAAAAAGSDK